MVNFSKNDFKIVLTMSLFLIIISFVFPVLGFTAGSVQTADIPSFNVSENHLNFVQEPPEMPSNPSEGTLTWEDGAQEFEDNRQEWIEADRFSITFFNQGSTSNPDMQVNLNEFNDTGGGFVDSSITENEYVLLELSNYSISFENMELGENNETATVDWEIHDQPEETSWINQIPLVGGLADALATIASIFSWFVSVIFHWVVVGLTAIANLFLSLFNILSFILSFFFWLLTTYADITTGAPTTYVSVFMALPGVLLSYEFAKLIILLVQTIGGVIPLT